MGIQSATVVLISIIVSASEWLQYDHRCEQQDAIGRCHGHADKFLKALRCIGPLFAGDILDIMTAITVEAFKHRPGRFHCGSGHVIASWDRPKERTLFFGGAIGDAHLTSTVDGMMLHVLLLCHVLYKTQIDGRGGNQAFFVYHHENMVFIKCLTNDNITIMR